mmetsp:Transcript_26755/g.77091  ORF Transcript_26755/g.77091 Transcript_26755/m.77091 type:complete len:387 (+) Transcript_26755:183-1343(+)
MRPRTTTALRAAGLRDRSSRARTVSVRSARRLHVGHGHVVPSSALHAHVAVAAVGAVNQAAAGKDSARPKSAATHRPNAGGAHAGVRTRRPHWRRRRRRRDVQTGDGRRRDRGRSHRQGQRWRRFLRGRQPAGRGLPARMAPHPRSRRGRGELRHQGENIDDLRLNRCRHVARAALGGGRRSCEGAGLRLRRHSGAVGQGRRHGDGALGERFRHADIDRRRRRRRLLVDCEQCGATEAVHREILRRLAQVAVELYAPVLEARRPLPQRTALAAARGAARRAALVAERWLGQVASGRLVLRPGPQAGRQASDPARGARADLALLEEPLQRWRAWRRRSLDEGVPHAHRGVHPQGPCREWLRCRVAALVGAEVSLGHLRAQHLDVRRT